MEEKRDRGIEEIVVCISIPPYIHTSIYQKNEKDFSGIIINHNGSSSPTGTSGL